RPGNRGCSSPGTNIDVNPTANTLAKRDPSAGLRAAYLDSGAASVYLDEAWNEGRAKGTLRTTDELVQASVEAGSLRVRPLLMTVMTNVFGLFAHPSRQGNRLRRRQANRRSDVGRSRVAHTADAARHTRGLRRVAKLPASQIEPRRKPVSRG